MPIYETSFLGDDKKNPPSPAVDEKMEEKIQDAELSVTDPTPAEPVVAEESKITEETAPEPIPVAETVKPKRKRAAPANPRPKKVKMTSEEEHELPTPFTPEPEPVKVIKAPKAPRPVVKRVIIDESTEPPLWFKTYLKEKTLAKVRKPKKIQTPPTTPPEDKPDPIIKKMSSLYSQIHCK